MPTVIGVIFFILGAYCFFLKEGSLLGLLIIASVFQASSAINIAERGIQPYYVVAAFIILRGITNSFFGTNSINKLPQGLWLSIFASIAVVSAFVLPVVFAGIPVYEPKIGIDDGLIFRPPLTFSLNNVAQAGFLAVDLATAYALLYNHISLRSTRKAFFAAFYLAVFFVVAQSACQFAHLPFPDSWIRNNPGYQISDIALDPSGTRTPGTFSEPSFAGAFLLLYCVGFIAEYLAGKGSTVRVIVSLVATGLVASSGSLLALSTCTLALVVHYLPFRFPWHLNIPRAKRLGWISLIIATPIAAALIGSSSYRETIATLTLSKSDSGSFLNRTASDLYAFKLLYNTHGLGVGLGSNRASSLVSSLLSNIGVIGFTAFAIFYIRLFLELPKRESWLRWGAFALLLNMSIDIPDVTFPVIWIAVFLALTPGLVESAKTGSRSRKELTYAKHLR